MPDPIKVSIQIPTYKQQHVVQRAVRSALYQQYPHLEVIVSDDCSPDYVIQSLFSEGGLLDDIRLRVHRNEKNLGHAGNYRHLLYEQVSGDYFMNLDGDDHYHQIDFLTEAVSIIAQLRDRFLVVSFEFGHKLDLVKKFIAHYEAIDKETILVKGTDYIEMLRDHRHFIHANCLFHVDTARKVNFYNRDNLSIDFYSALKLWTQGYLLLSSKEVFRWEEHSGNMTREGSLLNMADEAFSVEEFKAFARHLFAPKQLRDIITHLYYEHYRRVLGHFRGRAKSRYYYRYLVSNFRLNKYFIKCLWNEVTNKNGS